MTSRRNRIKKIANIPLRRKAINEKTVSTFMKTETPCDESNSETHVKTKENVLQRPLSGTNSNTEFSNHPPISSNKIFRSRIKAVPKLACHKASSKASESEDDSKKICSSTSHMQESISKCSHKPKGIMVAADRFKKIRMRSELTRKLARARKEFVKRFGASKPEMHRLIMMDFIFYNPDSNPMISNGVKNENENKMVNNPVRLEEMADDPVAEKNTKSDKENTLPVPQIKINLSGEMIVDEKSSFIERKKVQKQRDEIQKSKIVDADQFKPGYRTYKGNIRYKLWTHSETLLFYKALNTIGTDFMLMNELFPNRTRKDLKLKFKREEKVNGRLVDKALLQPCNFEEFEDLKNQMKTKEREIKEV